MADDTNPTPAVETAVAEVPSKTKEKKTRGPRKPRVVAEAGSNPSVSASVKKTRGPGKKAAATSAPVAAAPAVKPAALAKKAAPLAGRPAKRAAQKLDSAPVDTDGFAELLKLEEENQKLRKALADKLRAENADLRKKLGMA